MVNPATKIVIEEVVYRNMAMSIMFTDYDVTVTARKHSTTIHLADVREIINKMVASGALGTTYARTLINVGTPTETYLYHRHSHNPQSYISPESPSPQKGFIARLVERFFGGQNSKSPAHLPEKLPPSSTKPPTISPPATTNSVVSNPNVIFVGGWSSGIATTAQGASSGSSATHPQIATTASAAGAQSSAASTPSSTVRHENKTIDLDASQFLPITRNELLNAAKGTRLFGNVWFGRRDLIPPIDDPRTMLVDRGMVTEGIISPEELAEIHRVGAEMELHRPSLSIIEHKSNLASEAAVAELRAERARLKAQKQAEAQERKAARQAAIKDRRDNDIVFLGRRVSGRLGERESDLVRLQQLKLPELQTPTDVANALQLSISKLRWLAFHAEVAERTHYVNFEVPKSSGGFRQLSAPHQQLAAAQRWILENILNKLPTHPAAHGFVAGRSILSNAAVHVNQNFVINMDLENFFPSISFPRVRKMFARLGYSGSVATILALLCTECPRRKVTMNGQCFLVATGSPGLPQGACTSPAISNQISIKLDRRLQALAARMALNYTRYADDISFSGGQLLSEKVAYVMTRVRHFVVEEGFRINGKKTRVQRRNASQTVTGLVVNERPTVSRKKIRQIRAILHRAKSEGLEKQNRSNHPNFKAWLHGYISFIAMTRPEIAAQFRTALEQLRN